MLDSLGDKLRRLRNEHGFTLEQVAELIGMAKNTVYSYEADIREPSFSTLRRFACIYKVSTDYLLGLEEDEPFQVYGLSPEEKIILSNIADYMRNKPDEFQAKM